MFGCGVPSRTGVWFSNPEPLAIAFPTACSMLPDPSSESTVPIGSQVICTTTVTTMRDFESVAVGATVMVTADYAWAAGGVKVASAIVSVGTRSSESKRRLTIDLS